MTTTSFVIERRERGASRWEHYHPMPDDSTKRQATVTVTHWQDLYPAWDFRAVKITTTREILS